MKLLSLAAISLGILCLVVSAIGTLLKFYLLQVHPIAFIVLASTLFLLGIAIMCYDRFYGMAGDK